MKLISLSIPLNHPDCSNIKFFSNDTIIDGDIVVWSFEKTIEDIRALQYQESGTKILFFSKAHYDRINSAFEIRRKQFLEFLELGRILIIEMSGEHIIDSHVKLNPSSDILSSITFDLFTVLPFIKVTFLNQQGTNITCNSSKASLNNLFINSSGFLVYKIIHTNQVGTPFLYINNTKNIVGQYLKLHKGDIILFPCFKRDQTGDDFIKNPPRTTQFATALLEFSKELKDENKEIIFQYKNPDWSKEYLLPNELQVAKTIDELERARKGIEDKINAQKAIMKEYEELKELFCADADILEKSVKKIFAEIGFTIEKTEPGRDDLILKFEDKVYVGEVKGVKGSGAEKHAAQLEKWVSDYIINNGIHPKGILIVNAFKDTPLDERNTDAFPHQMLKHSKQRELCLISGIQLLNLYLHFKFKNLEAVKIAQLLYETIGVFNYEPLLIEKAV